LLYKTNLLLLIPAIAWTCAAGPLIVSTITGGKFLEYSWIFPLLVFQVTIGSHVVLLQLILNAVNASVLLLKSSVLALIVMAAFLVVVMTTDLVNLVYAPLVFSLINNCYIVYKLRARGYCYKPAWKRLIGATFSGAIVPPFLFLFQIPAQDFLGPIAFMFLSGVCILTAYLFGVWLLGVLEKSEIAFVRSLLQPTAVMRPKKITVDNQI
jgi:pyruvyl transferase EpsO